MQEHPACDVCSRTLLKGERLHEYVSPQGQRFGACVHCRTRAEASGWIPAEQWGTFAHEPPSRGGRGAALRRRLGQVASRARRGAGSGRSVPKVEPPSPPETDAKPVVAREPADEASAGPEEVPASGPVAAEATEARAPRPKQTRAPRPRPQPKRAKRPASKADPAPQAQPAPKPRRGPEAIMRAAVERFNSSEEPHKVAGLIRSLGEPQAAVRPDPSRQLALVTVAWELSWYQWEVSANGDDESVREVAKGNEVSELNDEARAWNAAVGDDGSLRLRSGGQRRQASGTEA
ncbi:MAG TPA: hypothetical protein VH391_04035 [Solirubrobacterales bacterium]